MGKALQWWRRQASQVLLRRREPWARPSLLPGPTSEQLREAALSSLTGLWPRSRVGAPAASQRQFLLGRARETSLCTQAEWIATEKASRLSQRQALRVYLPHPARLGHR